MATTPPPPSSSTLADRLLTQSSLQCKPDVMTSTSSHDDDDALDPQLAAQILGDGGRIGSRLNPDPRVLFGVWGIAWLVGFGALWITARDAVDLQPAGWAFAVFYALLAAAVVVTIVHVARRSRGLRGTSATTGAMYGWSWCVAFVVVGLVLGALARADADPAVMAIVSTALPCLVVGVLYMAGAATYRDGSWFALGAWIAVMAGIGAMAGVPSIYVVMSVAGGGGLLVGALACHVAGRRGRGRA